MTPVRFLFSFFRTHPAQPISVQPVGKFFWCFYGHRPLIFFLVLARTNDTQAGPLYPRQLQIIFEDV